MTPDERAAVVTAAEKAASDAQAARLAAEQQAAANAVRAAMPIDDDCSSCINIVVQTATGRLSCELTVSDDMTIGEVKELLESEELQSETQSCGADSLANLREVVVHALSEWGSYRLVLNEDANGAHTVCEDEQSLREVGACTASKLMIVPPSEQAGGVSEKPILVTIPVGNNPARIRLLIYLKGLDDQIEMRTPEAYGGLLSEEYKKINPQGKIPVLVLPDGTTLFESRVIAGYIADRWSSSAPSLVAPTAELRARAELINQVHDLYIASANSSDPTVTATQAAMYKSVELIDAQSRAAKVAEIAKQLDVLEGLVVGPYCAGEAISQADLAMFPTFIFFTELLPQVFGWSPFDNRPKLAAWFANMEELPAAQRLKAEMVPALNGWADSGRFEPIREQVNSANELKWVFP